MPDRMKPSAAWAAAVVVTAAGVLSLASAPAASAATTTSCASGYSIGVLHLPAPTIHLGTSCTGFSDAGSPYVFKIAIFNAISNQQPYNTYFHNVTATCTAYSAGGTDLVATGCTFTFGSGAAR
ncbi:hypothetical protein [Amycolatopsis sp. NPDC004625]|uniref:hypothetical protein n=1 Tax=Amycolatopsis sp. NPDC004625 TaxID=3154670 RepID=UPI00339E0A30